MDAHCQLRSRPTSGIQSRTRLSVIGLEYIGLAHAVHGADPGHEFLAADVNQDITPKAPQGEVRRVCGSARHGPKDHGKDPGGTGRRARGTRAPRRSLQ